MCLWPAHRGAELNGFVYVYRGKGLVGGRALSMGQVVVMDEGVDGAVVLRAEKVEMRALVLAGRPIREPVARCTSMRCSRGCDPPQTARLS